VTQARKHKGNNTNHKKMECGRNNRRSPAQFASEHIKDGTTSTSCEKDRQKKRPHEQLLYGVKIFGGKGKT
jgi:hypothetical protein